MAIKYLNSFPKPLLDDLVADRWLPIIGAGFSKNAIFPSTDTMPLWADLSEKLCSELDGYEATTPIDGISAYEHAYGRPKLIERLYELQLIDEAIPGDTHYAFCSIPFDLVCTTNFDFLLDQQYRRNPRPFNLIIEEKQLSINHKNESLGLFKLHGDLDHSDRLVVTESDYDGFLKKYPLLATYLANLLINRTAVFIGYSLDDPDFRQVWHIIGARLGRSRRKAYVITVSPKPTDKARFERRGVNVISLPGEKIRYAEILTQTFNELREYWEKTILPASEIREEHSLRELSLPETANNRLCFFAVPSTLQPFYRELVFPLARKNGFAPMTVDEIKSPGESILPITDALAKRAGSIVVDITSQWTLGVLYVANNVGKTHNTLVISAPGSSPPSEMEFIHHLERPKNFSKGLEKFLKAIDEWFKSIQELKEPSFVAEPQRLLDAGEYRAAIISSITLLETDLRRRLDLPEGFSKGYSLRILIRQAHQQGLLGNLDEETVFRWQNIRNDVVHTQRKVDKRTAKSIVDGVLKVIQSPI